MGSTTSITISAPAKVHLLGEHSVVYGKPAILTTVDLRVTVTIKPMAYIDTIIPMYETVKRVAEDVVKKYLHITTIPPYQLNISSQIPLGSGLGSSAAVSAAYIAALLSFLKINWDLNLVNRLTYETEKVFHGNPSGGDNSTVVFGGLIWFRKESPDLKIIKPLEFTIPSKLAKDFVLINTGKPNETTKQMVEIVAKQSARFKKIFDHQEQLVKDLLPVLQNGNENQLIQIIRAGEKNLEAIGVVSLYVKSIIRKIEKAGGAAKICGAGGKTKGAGIVLAYHPNKLKLEKLAKSFNLPFFTANLGAEGLKME